MGIRSFGTADSERLKQAEQQMGVELPDDYREFLLQTNGGSNEDYSMSFFVKELNDEMVVDVLYGIGLDNKNADVVFYTDMFASDMLPGSVLIGDSIQNGFIVMVCGRENKGIYYWDHSYTYEASDDENNMYRIADTFGDFLRMLDRAG